MKKPTTQGMSQDAQLAVVGSVIVLFALGYVIYDLHGDRTLLRERVVVLERELTDTHEMLAASEERGRQLTEALEAEQERLRTLGEEVENLTGTVGDLEKLSQLAPELLQKYSKVYFLNEHFVPERLRDIDDEFLYYEDRREQVDRRVWLFLEDLLEDARRDGVELYVVSGYRSFGTQATVKSNYVVQYGSGANAFSAEQGYSEHQLGTTVDFITTGIGGTLSGFETTEAYGWLLENAHKYGFTLSYPEGNTYYIFEPWHWRFVGRDLARDLERKNLHFYDLPQSDIDGYLLEIFD